ncbi:LysM peptidoglycan-binding domain-containing protein [Arthrobacter yangruifuii]|uniref:LysM peptidoglycan-binding domain-containing protein n=1 Tax=Arthrobacter yangruifuii TaxID=2606616 RepID=A0A5N6MUK4_9MICC|nr:LysM peptidoglycan-binding domain-containing protein [Arthrobacter yangruifuii]KAD4060513.1 LysM peptidoglycan-binding domain-containing protein [Arthrobacter yangruifuii]
MTGMTSRPGLAADALVTAGIAAAGVILLWCGSRIQPEALGTGVPLLSPHRGAGLSGTALTQIAGLGAASAGVLLTLWWTAGFACALAGCLLHRSGFRSAGRRTLALAPGPLRRLASAALGISLAAGGPLGALPAASASAAAVFQATGSGTGSPLVVPGPEAVAARPAGGPEDTADTVSPLWRPSPPASSPPDGGLLTGTPRRDEREVVVAAGDTLWSLAAAQLGPQATDAETAAHWPRWYELNREVIGPDPGLIHPGQVLAVPPP